MATTRAAIIERTGAEPVVADVEVPSLEPGGVLVAVDTATLCGTDVHFWHGDVVGGPEHPYIPGHETCGRIVEINGARRDVTGDPLRVGDRVIWTYPFCRQCFYCTVANAPTLCSNMARFGRARSDRAPFLLGGCAEMHYVPPGCEIVKVPEHVPSDLAAAASCSLRTVMHGFERIGEIPPDASVLVQGCGAVGLFATAVARDRGARSVLVIGDPDDRHELAQLLGSDATCGLDRSADERRAWVRDATSGRGADVVVQCATAAAIPEAIDLVRPGGTVLCIGGGGAAPPIDPAAFAKTLTITSVRGGEGRHYRRAIEYLAKRPIEPFRGIVAEPVPLERTGDALVAMAKLEQIKPVIRPS